MDMNEQQNEEKQFITVTFRYVCDRNALVLSLFIIHASHISDFSKSTEARGTNGRRDRHVHQEKATFLHAGKKILRIDPEL